MTLRMPRSVQAAHALTGPHVLAATPALGAYPDSLSTPAAFPGESPGSTSAGATGTIASPPPAASTAVPIDTLNGADFG